MKKSAVEKTETTDVLDNYLKQRDDRLMNFVRERDLFDCVKKANK